MDALPRPTRFNEGGSNSTLVVSRTDVLPVTVWASMKEGRIRPSLLCSIRRYVAFHYRFNEGGSNSTLVDTDTDLTVNEEGAASMKEGRIRPSLWVVIAASSSFNTWLQ